MARRVLITGGSRGIGRALVDRYAAAGYEVIAPTRQELDLATSAAISTYFSQPDRRAVDVLINNAGENRIKAIEALTPDEWQRMLMINLTAPFMLIQQVAPYMARQGWGRIVNISSIYSQVSRAGRSAYGASKAGLNSLTRTAALEYAEHGVLVNAVCPGFIETDLTHQNNTPAQIEMLKQQVPLKRLGTPAEVAELVFHLGSAMNTFQTGQLYVIDGGFLVQ
jgi:NAD(P)-dependent dehydrogenase (short-subunit alcohol dehydrogenase family)